MTRRAHQIWNSRAHGLQLGLAWGFAELSDPAFQLRAKEGKHLVHPPELGDRGQEVDLAVGRQHEWARAERGFCS